ncbi:hypothetical protein A2U01_0009719, partial [Trifolium medium]|nr:hypothetical protein [Trifolium medium]
VDASAISQILKVTMANSVPETRSNVRF